MVCPGDCSTSLCKSPAASRAVPCFCLNKKRFFCKLPGQLALAEMQLHLVALEHSTAQQVWLYKASLASGKAVQIHLHGDDNGDVLSAICD